MSIDTTALKQIILKQQYQIDDLKNDIAFLREQAAQPKWQPIETAPIEQKILVFSKEHGVTVIFIYFHPKGGHNGVTHWMPLPEPPEGTK